MYFFCPGIFPGKSFIYQLFAIIFWGKTRQLFVNGNPDTRTNSKVIGSDPFPLSPPYFQGGRRVMAPCVKRYDNPGTRGSGALVPRSRGFNQHCLSTLSYHFSGLRDTSTLGLEGMCLRKSINSYLKLKWCILLAHG